MKLNLITSLGFGVVAWFIATSSHATAQETNQSPLAIDPELQQQQFDQIPAQQREEYEEVGQQWFDRMVTALRELNYDATLVHLQGDRVEPLRWLHGQGQDGTEVELLMRLNGPDYRVLRIDDQTAYYQPAANSYSLRSDVVHGLIPTAFYHPFSELADYYRALPVGGGRVVGRDAQHIRLISRDNLRYGYSLWLDRETGMLLKSAMVTPRGEIAEQIQLTSVSFHERVPVNLKELQDVPKPPLLTDANGIVGVSYKTNLNWLPEGFKLLRSNRHQLVLTGIFADYYLFSDGLTAFSLYVSEYNDESAEPMALNGPESLYTTVTESGFVVTIVGKLPIESIKKIADNISVQTVSSVANE